MRHTCICASVGMLLYVASAVAISQPAQIVAQSSPGSAAQPQTGHSASIPATNLPKASPEEIERRRRIVEQMDREREEKERTALRDSPDGKRACAMLQSTIRDAESGVIRGQGEDRRLTPAEQSQVLPAMRQQYDKACR